MSRHRNLKQQGRYAVEQAKAFGQKKHIAPKDIKAKRLYSYARCDGIRNVNDQLLSFVEKHFPEIKWIRDVTNEHTTAWMKSKEWTSGETFHEYRSRLSKLQEVCKATYGNCRHPGNWGTVDMEPPTTGKIRDVSMTREDFYMIRDSIMRLGRSNAWIAMEITARSGIRVKGCHWLSGKDIDLEKGTVFVCKEGAKNGRTRTLPLRPEDREFYSWLKKRTPEDRVFRRKNGKVLLPGSIDSTIREHMKKLGLDENYPCTTEHAIRKMFAKERMEALRGPAALTDKKAEMKAWGQVSVELGHGENRPDLYKTYVK